ncbi:MAG: lantibiotic dehydratase, partial [Bacteroidetes bacterium]|nr:lantibiotic dehydratase [Bacteroidota bacterium]
DLHTQYFQKSGLGFNWGNLSNGYKFLPRAEYKNVVLARAKWQLSKSDFQVLLDEKKSSYITDIGEWRKQWNIPQYVVLADGDNELLVNLEDELSIKMLVSSIKNRDKIVLEEFLFDIDNLIIKDKNGNGYTNEFIGILLKNTIPIATASENVVSLKKMEVDLDKSMKRTFSIGSEWIYYKFYSGIKTADKLLAEVIRPLTEELLDKKRVDKFFFIRYADPDTHIRLRFHIKELNELGNVIASVNQAIQPYMNQGLVTKIQTDTYKQELERYGLNSMEIGESIFFIDSVVTLNMLNLIDGEEGEKIRWQFAVRSLDDLLTNFKFNSNEKLILLEHLKDGFIREHGGSKELKLQLDTKFRNIRKQVEDILNQELDATREILPLIELLEWKKEQMEPLVEKIIGLKNSNELQIPLNDLLASYIHMMLNRIFKSRQRTYELVVYDLLYKYYKSLAGREKSKKKSTTIETI